MKLSESAANGKKGVVVVRFQIQKDGTLLGKSPAIVSTSGKKDMNEAAVSAIRTAAPFGRLPQACPGSNMDLEFVSYYNSVLAAQEL